MIKQAVCALIYRPDNKILGVSRKDDKTKFGLVGGKVEKNEQPTSALIREVKEETGLEVISFKECFTTYDDEYWVITYICEVKGDILPQDKLDPSETGVIKDVTWEELFDGPFGSYNRYLYTHLYSPQD